jgi:hypothetical protein
MKLPTVLAAALLAAASLTTLSAQKAPLKGKPAPAGNVSSPTTPSAQPAAAPSERKPATADSVSSLALVADSQTVTLRPHFTERSKRIVIPKKGSKVLPEIREGMIAISDGVALPYRGVMMYVNAEDGEYVWGTDFPLHNSSGYGPVGKTRLPESQGPGLHNSGYFSGGAVMGNLRLPDPQGPGLHNFRPPKSEQVAIIYPNGTYRLLSGINELVDFNEGYGLVYVKSKLSDDLNKLTFIDKEGRSAFPKLSTLVKHFNPDDYYYHEPARVYPLLENRRLYYSVGWSGDRMGKFGYADGNGAIVIKPQFDHAEGFSDGLAAVMIKDENNMEKWGFIDATGKMVIPATFKLRPGRFTEGLAAVRVGDSNNYEMTYIDKTGKRVMESKPWELGEFHNGFAWVNKSGERKAKSASIINDKFAEVRVVEFEGTPVVGKRQDRPFQPFYYVVSGVAFDDFSPMELNFQNGSQALDGRIYAPDGTVLFDCVEARVEEATIDKKADKDGRLIVNDRDVRVKLLHDLTEGELMLCQCKFKDEPRLKEKDASLQCFINKKGEIVYYFEVGFEGFEGKKPVELGKAK